MTAEEQKRKWGCAVYGVVDAKANGWIRHIVGVYRVRSILKDALVSSVLVDRTAGKGKCNGGTEDALLQVPPLSVFQGVLQ